MVMDYLGASIPDYSGLDFSQYAPQVPPAATPEPAPQVSQTSGALDAASFSPSNLRAVMLANPSITIDELAKGFGVSVDDVSNALSLNPANWDKSVSDYYNQLGEYRKQMEDQGFFLLDPRQAGGYFDPKGYFVNTSFVPEAGVSIPSMYGPANQDYYRSMMGEYADPSKFYQTVMMYKSPTGKGESEYFGSVVADPNKQYRLVDTNTDQVIYSGTGLEALKEINKLVPSLSTKPSETWSLDVSEGGDKWTPSGVQKINTDTPGFMKALGTLLPIATAFIPGLNLLGTVATQAASGAIGAGMAGRDPLTGALIGGATAGLMGAPILKGGQSISEALGQAVGAGGKGAVEAAAGALPGEIVVTAAPKLLESAINAGVAGLTQQIGSALPSLTQSQQPTLEQQFDETFGTGTPQAPTTTGGGLSALEPPITVVGTPSSALNIAPGIPGIGAGALTSAINATQPTGTSGSDRLEQTQEQPVESKDDIVVKAWNAGSDVAAAAAAAGITTAAAQAIIQAAQTAGQADLRKVAETQTTTGALPPVPSGTGGLTVPEYVDTTPIEVVAEPKPLDLTGPAPVVTIPPGALTEIGNTIPNLPEPQTETPPAEEIVVKGKPETQPTPTPVIPPATTTTTTQTTDTTKADTKADTTTDSTKKPLTLEQILELLGLSTGLIGDLLGGGGGGGALGTIPAGLFTSGTGTSIFNKPLPAPNLPGLGPGGTGIGARSPSDFTATTGLPTPGSGASNIDWYRYGYGPEQSFFKQVPQGAKNASQAFTGYEVPFRGLQNMAEGGYAVGGPGDGRDDKIPAMLSDGEYVMDAETVAMLGNGSSKAGAKALDRFRVNIRKHKGRSMARGNFSVKAKKPEKYLQKDRA